MLLRKVFRFRMNPTRAQEHLLAQQAGARRWVWNWALETRTGYYRMSGKGMPYKELSASLTMLKKQPETSWLALMNAQALQQALQDQNQAFQNFFAKRARFPRFKSKKNRDASFRIPQSIHIENGRVFVPKIGYIKIRQSQEIDGTIKGATFKQDASRHWHVCLVSEFEMPDTSLPLPDPEKTVGIDVGLKDLMVLSTGERISPPKFFRKSEQKLRRAQRRLSRAQKGSRRRTKARLRVARVHQRIANQRKDFTHKLTTRLVRQHDALCFETLNIQGLARTKLAKSILDAAWGECIRQSKYKTLWNRKRLAQSPRFFRSTKECRFCHTVRDDLTLADRFWTCPGCLACHDRDLHAAQRIRDVCLPFLLSVGHTAVNARGVDVRPPMEAVRC